MSTTVIVVIVWPWEPMDLPGSRSIPGKSQQWILLSQLVSKKSQQWGVCVCVYHSLRKSAVSPIWCVLGLGTHNNGVGFYSVIKRLFWIQKSSDNRIPKCEMAFYNVYHLISLLYPFMLLIPILFLHLRERKCFRYNIPRFGQLFARFRMRALSYLGKCMFERPKTVKLCNVWEYWTFQLPFNS